MGPVILRQVEEDVFEVRVVVYGPGTCRHVRLLAVDDSMLRHWKTGQVLCREYADPHEIFFAKKRMLDELLRIHKILDC